MASGSSVAGTPAPRSSLLVEPAARAEAFVIDGAVFTGDGRLAAVDRHEDRATVRGEDLDPVARAEGLVLAAGDDPLERFLAVDDDRDVCLLGRFDDDRH